MGPEGRVARVSIVVAARNEAAYIGACIEALQRQTVPVEIIVADGRSTDDTAAIARAAGAHVVDNPGLVAPAAFNAGIRASTGDVIGIMSAHAEPEPDCVERSLAALDSTGAWAVVGRIVRTGETPWQRAIAAATSSRLGVGDASHNYATTARPVETGFPGMWPRWVFDRVGFFDEGQVRSQDAELSYRIRRAGGMVWYDPAIRVRYHPRATLGSLFRQFHDYGRWKVRLWRKHPGSLRWRQVIPAVWIASLVVGLAWSPLLVVSVGVYGALMLTRGPRVAAALVTMHAAYGTGTWRGLLRPRAHGCRS